MVPGPLCSANKVGNLSLSRFYIRVCQSGRGGGAGRSITWDDPTPAEPMPIDNGGARRCHKPSTEKERDKRQKKEKTL